MWSPSPTRPLRGPVQPPPAGRGLALALALAAGAASAGCADPTRERAIAALGPEDPAVPPGPRHRPNQPCLTCHDPAGTASAMTVAGTVYRARAGAVPAGGVDVLLTDAARETFITRSNCAGNFFVYPGTFRPRPPIWATVRAGDQRIDMESPMHKDADCGHCHQDPPGPTAAGHIFLGAGPEEDAAATTAGAAAPPCTAGAP